MSDYWQEERYRAMHLHLHGRLPDEPAPQPKPARILITGSREFTSVHLMRTALRAVRDEYGMAATVVHGNARGADRLAASIAQAWGMPTEAHEADWAAPCRAECSHGSRRRRRDGSTYCPAAGDYRNQGMVDAGAGRCLAFLVADLPCKGTRDCMRRAERAGIPVRVFEQRTSR